MDVAESEPKPAGVVAVAVAAVLGQTVIYLRGHVMRELWSQIAAAVPAGTAE